MQNKPQPKLTISGYRGIWGESLTNEIVENYTKAFAKFVQEDINKNPTILIGRDGRESGPEIKEIIKKTLKELNIKFIDGDILPTPTVLFSVKNNKYDGAIIITASHNPIEYNGLKFVNNKALFVSQEEVEKIKENYEEIQQKTSVLKNIFGKDVALERLGRLSSRARGIFQQKNIRALQSNNLSKDIFVLPQQHADQILKHINVDAIKAKKFKVAVDMINASACVLDPYLFEKLGVELVPLNNIPNGKFAHRPEPLRENLEDIGNLVREKHCDLGFAHDPDADRLVIINEKGEVVFEEYTLAFGVEAILSKNPHNKVVINMSTSQMNKDIALKYGGTCIHTKVGEANVVAGIIKNNAIIGGEGGGGIIYPTINMARDSFVSLALILELLAERNQTVSECIETLPKYEMKKDKMPINGDLNEIYSKMKNHFSEAKINEEDGLRLDFPDNSWLQLRPSNTEPIIRLFGEAKTKERIEELFREAGLLIR